MTADEATVDSDTGRSPATDDRRSTATITATRAAAEPASAAESLPNTLTIIGGGRPSSFELTVDGEIELAAADRDAGGVVLSGSTVEGAIETGTITFRFDGELTDVTFVDCGITGRPPATTPNVHVDYGEQGR